MARGRFYETFEIPGVPNGVAKITVHDDGARRQAWRELLERARAPGVRGMVRDAGVSIPERVEHARIQEDARRRTYGSRRRDDDDELFHYDSRNGWHEGPLARDRHADALRQFRDALRQFYDQGGEEGPIAEFLAWIRGHMDPAEWKSPRPDPNRLTVPSVLKYAWPDPKRFAEGYGLKTSAGRGSSETMAAGSAGFRDSSKPRSVADLNQLHRRYYAGRVL